MILSLVLAVLAWRISPERILRDDGAATRDHAAEFSAVATELRRGASLRHSIAAVYPETQLARLAMTGQPIGWVAAELERTSGGDDPLVGAGLQLAATSGAAAAPLFGALADRIRTRQELATRKRVLTAQAKLSALVIAGLPVLVGLLLAPTRSLSVLSASAGARTAVLLGALMELIGASAVLIMVRRAAK